MGRHRKEDGGLQTDAVGEISRRLALQLSRPVGVREDGPSAERHASDIVAAPAATRVSGDSDAGTAVSGLSSSGVGVGGISSSGPGVSGFSSAGIGVLAASPHGNALAVHGRAHFSRSGSAQVPKGAKTQTVTVSGMSADSLVLVTLQSAHSGVSVLGAVPEDGTFAVHLNKKAPRETRFAWFVLN